jgi:hypothetical protein
MTDPHEAAPDENPEQHIGEVLPDPWDEREFEGLTPVEPEEI